MQTQYHFFTTSETTAATKVYKLQTFFNTRIFRKQTVRFCKKILLQNVTINSKGGLLMKNKNGKKFSDNRLGMFIHWGIYSVSGVQDQVIARFDMDNKEYEKYASVFNPQKYNPQKWVSLAKKAGMKYICFTSKHHDGFCMWDTKYTSYNIMNTPYGKDVLKMLCEECKKQSMGLSIYYSCPDWHHEYGYNPDSTHQWKAINKENPDTQKYIEYVRNQITELMTNYGKIYSLFWDIPPGIKDKSLNELVRELQPGIYINDRGYDMGDFSTPEREYETTDNTKRFERMTEACNSVGEQSWGYRENEDYHSIRHLTTSIDKFMAMGANYLLNVGPKPDGTIPKESVDIIKKVGKWYNRMEGSLENSVVDSFNYKIQKHKCIVNIKNKKSYFNFFEGITSSSVALKKFPSKPENVRLLNTGKELKFEIERLPEYFSLKTGKADGEYLHITGIPIDKLQNEPIVIEITW